MKSARGFTLIELLVVISIIAILSVIGITVFSGVQKSARDATRRSDIDAIAKAMEVHYGEDTAHRAQGPYTYLRNSWFASGTIPKDPLSGQNSCNGQPCKYCDRSAASGYPQFSLPPGPGPGLCAAAGNPEVLAAHAPGNGPGDDYTGYNFGGWPTWNAAGSYVVCANLEGGGFYCKSNQQ